MPPGMMVISKGTDPKKDAKSGFEGSSLADRLEDLEVKTIYVLGPATHECLEQTIADAKKLDFQVVVLKDALGVTEARLKATFPDGTLHATALDFGIHPSSN